MVKVKTVSRTVSQCLGNGTFAICVMLSGSSRLMDHVHSGMSVGQTEANSVIKAITSTTRERIAKISDSTSDRDDQESSWEVDEVSGLA